LTHVDRAADTPPRDETQLVSRDLMIARMIVSRLGRLL
jgi:hypothetical protein